MSDFRPGLLADRVVALDTRRTILLAAEQNQRGELMVNFWGGEFVGGDFSRQQLLLAVRPNVLRDLARALDGISGELGVRP